MTLFDWLRGRRPRVTVGEADWRRIESRLPFLDFLPVDDRPRLREMAIAFLDDKQWSGAQGLVPYPDMQLAIALQACLPVLNLGLEWYDHWVGIVLYPGDFVIPRQTMDEDGVVHEYEDAVLGEAWPGGPVLLSWFDDPEEIAGINVVIHEFVHKLDMRGGEADGVPPLHPDMSRRGWIAAMQDAFDGMNARLDAGGETEFDPYAAEHPSEFFAVISEAFFETPGLVLKVYPEVYRQLALFYRQDPAPREQDPASTRMPPGFDKGSEQPPQ